MVGDVRTFQRKVLPPSSWLLNLGCVDSEVVGKKLMVYVRKLQEA